MISYVGIRGDEDREGYISKKNTIQSIFPFRRNIWSEDVNKLILANSGIAYYYTEATDTFGQITDAAFPIASSITSLDGYTIVSEAETGKFFVSDLRDTTVWSSLAQGTAEALSDNIVALATYQRQLFLLGESSIEVWYDSGVTAQPFRPINQTFIAQGCIGKNALTVSQSGLFWVADSKSIFWTQSFSVKKISTFGIDYLLSQISKPENIIAFLENDLESKLPLRGKNSALTIIKFPCSRA